MSAHVVGPLLALLLTQPPPPRPGHDLYGDPLPPGAVARLGTTRFHHDGRVSGVAFLPDGNGLLAADESGKVVLWDAKTGKRLRGVVAQDSGIEEIALPADGRTLAVRGSGGDVALWDVASGRLVGRFFTPWPVVAFAFAPDGKFVATVDDHGNLFFWDPGTGHVLRGIETCLGRSPGLAISAEGRVLASSSRGVFEWDAATGTRLLCLPGPDDGENPGRAVAFAPDGREFAVADPDRRGIAFWQTRSGRELRRGRATAELRGFVFSPDGKTLAASDKGGGVTLWDVAAGRERRRLSREAGPVAEHLTFSPDGRLLAEGTGLDIHLWDTESGREVGLTARHHGAVEAVACSSDGKTIATASADGTVRLWDRTTGRPLHCLRGHGEVVWAVAFAPDGKSLVSGGHDGTLRLWDVATGKERRRFFEKGSGRVDALAFAPDGRALAAAKGGLVVVCDPATGRQLRELPRPWGLFCSLAWTPDGKTIVAACPGAEEVGRWEASTGRGLPPLRADRGKFTTATMSPDRRVIATSGQDQGIQLWDAVTGGELRRLAADDYHPFSVTFSPDGWTLAVRGHPRGDVVLVEVLTGAERGRLEGQVGWQSRVAFSPDGRALVTGGDDTTALVWDLSARATARPPVGEELWVALTSRDARRGYEALTSLIASPRRAIALMEKKLAPVPAAQAGHLARLIADLDHDDFATRERATADLEAYDFQVLAPLLRRALAGQPSPEVKRRIEDLLQRLQAGEIAPDRRAQARALEALEHINAPEARTLLRRLAQGAPDAWLTREANAVLRRAAR